MRCRSDDRTTMGSGERVRGNEQAAAWTFGERADDLVGYPLAPESRTLLPQPIISVQLPQMNEEKPGNMDRFRD